MVSQPLRSGNIRQSAIQYLFKQRIAARNGISHYITIRFQGHLLDTIAFNKIYTCRFKLCTHRRIDTSVTTRDTMPCGASQLGYATHESATDPENMNMHTKNPS